MGFIHNGFAGDTMKANWEEILKELNGRKREHPLKMGYQYSDVREVLGTIGRIGKNYDFRVFIRWIFDKEITLNSFLGLLIPFDYMGQLQYVWHGVYPIRCG